MYENEPKRWAIRNKWALLHNLKISFFMLKGGYEDTISFI